MLKSKVLYIVDKDYPDEFNVEVKCNLIEKRWKKR